MPVVDEESVALDTYAILRLGEEGFKAYIDLLEGCEYCFIVDKPSIVTVKHGLDIVLGVGSLVCRKCSRVSNSEYLYIVENRAWIDGREIVRGAKCYTNDARGLSFLVKIGAVVEEVEYNGDFLDRVRDTPGKHFIVLPSLGSPYLEKTGRICGKTFLNNPLHPSVSMLKPEREVCFEKMGFVAWKRYNSLISPLATLITGNSSSNHIPIVSVFETIRSRSLLAGFTINDAMVGAPAKTGIRIGVIYECMSI